MPVDDPLFGDATSAERGKPQGSPAVAGINQRLRVRCPVWFHVIAVCLGEPAGLAVAQPQVPVATL
jgi:hypothetical protein